MTVAEIVQQIEDLRHSLSQMKGNYCPQNGINHLLNAAMLFTHMMTDDDFKRKEKKNV